jgi:site-specific DNA-methyltransferase (adenine-specific)
MSKFDIRHGDCLELMKDIPDRSIDLILCDLPYGTVSCSWDSIIPFEPLWEQYKRIIRPNAAIVLTAVQPFTTKLISSNMDMFKYCWYWEKSKGANFVHANFQPLKVVEDIVVFSNGASTFVKDATKNMKYYPQKIEKDKPYTRDSSKDTNRNSGAIVPRGDKEPRITEYTHSTPRNLVYYATDGDGRVHPTQKPVGLMEYLIKTYTLENETVLDNTMGSGTTGVACMNTDRNFIGMEMEEKYFDIASKRIQEAHDIMEHKNAFEGLFE